MSFLHNKKGLKTLKDIPLIYPAGYNFVFDGAVNRFRNALKQETIKWIEKEIKHKHNYHFEGKTETRPDFHIGAVTDLEKYDNL